MKRTGKNNLIYLMALILVIIAFIAFATYGMLDGSKDEEWYPVSVIVENSSSDRFTSFREGLERGAEDYHIRLNVVSTGAFSGIEEEYQIIHREIDNGAKGVIVEMCDSSNYTDDSAVEIGSDKMILVETDVEAEGMYAAILPQSYEMGEAVAEAVIADYGEKLEDTDIGILAGNLKQTAGQQCLKGFMDKIESAGASILWNLSDEDNVNNTFEWCLEKKRVDIVVSHPYPDNTHFFLSSQFHTVQILSVPAPADNQQPVPFCHYLMIPRCLPSFSQGTIQMYYLDKGVIGALVVPNEFNIGYLSAAAIAGQLREPLSSAKTEKVGFLTITKDNLYDEENQKILFPIVQ